MGSMFKYYLTSPGTRPPSAFVVRHLWGGECDIDSDGNEDQLLVGGWTELTVALRPECKERVDVDPIDDSEPLVLVIRSESSDLAKRTALFLQFHSGGNLSDQPPR